jgi:hypothetical protein
MSESNLVKKQGLTIRRPQEVGPEVKLVERLSDSWCYWLMCWVVSSVCLWVQLALRPQEESKTWEVVKFESGSELDSMGRRMRMLTT